MLDPILEYFLQKTGEDGFERCGFATDVIAALFFLQVLVAFFCVRFQLHSDPLELGYQFTCLIFVIYISYRGCILGPISYAMTDRLSGYYLGSEEIIWLQTGYMLWNLVICLIYKSKRNIDEIIHHVVAAVTAYCSHKPYFHGTIPLALGLMEISTIFLSIYFVEKMFDPATAGPVRRFLRQSSKILFPVTFFLLRWVLWSIVTFQFYQEQYNLWLKHGELPNFWFAMGYSAANISASILQFYWGFKIFKRAYRELFPKPKSV